MFLVKYFEILVYDCLLHVLSQEDDDDGMAEEKEIRDVDDDDDDDEKTDIDGDDQSTGRNECDFFSVWV